MAFSQRDRALSRTFSSTLTSAARMGEFNDVRKLLDEFHAKENTEHRLEYIYPAVKHCYTPLLAAVRALLDLYKKGMSPLDKRIHDDYLATIRLLLKDDYFRKQINDKDYFEKFHSHCTALHYAVYVAMDGNYSERGREVARDLAVLLVKNGCESQTLGALQKSFLEGPIAETIAIEKRQKEWKAAFRPKEPLQIVYVPVLSAAERAFLEKFSKEEEEARIAQLKLKADRHSPSSESVAASLEETGSEPQASQTPSSPEKGGKRKKKAAAKARKQAAKEKPSALEVKSIDKEGAKSELTELMLMEKAIPALLKKIAQEQKANKAKDRCASYELLLLIETIEGSRSPSKGQAMEVLLDQLKIPKFFSKEGIAYLLNVKKMELAARAWVFANVSERLKVASAKQMSDKAEKSMLEIFKTIKPGMVDKFLEKLPPGIKMIAACNLAKLRSGSKEKKDHDVEFVTDYASLCRDASHIMQEDSEEKQEPLDLEKEYYKLFGKDKHTSAVFALVNRPEELVAFEKRVSAAEKKGTGLDSQDHFACALCFEIGLGTDQNQIKSFEHLQIAIKQGHPKAQCERGYKILHDLGILPFDFSKKPEKQKDRKKMESEKEAIRLLQNAADQGLSSAQFYLGLALFNQGENEKFLILLKKAAEQGYYKAQLMLGDFLMFGDESVITRDAKEACQWFQRAVEQDYASGSYQLGQAYRDGKVVPQDPEAAKKYYRYSAEHDNDPVSQSEIGDILYYSTSGEDEQEAFQWFSLSAPRSTFGKYMMAVCLKDGIGVEQDIPRAIKLFEELSDQDADSAVKLGECYEFGISVDIDPKRAFNLYQQAAEAENPSGLYNLGKCYEFGIGVKEDPVLAAQNYKIAAELGHAKAQFAYGHLLNYGIGIEQDEEAAIKLIMKAADQGHREAQIAYADYLQKGSPEEQKDAFQIFQTLAQNGDAEAQCRVAKCFSYGKGVPKDEKTAANEFKKSALQGFAEAQLQFGHCLKNGTGVQQDFAAAVSFYRMAAEQDLDMALFSLAVCYEYGEGVLKDVSQAMILYKRAADLGHKASASKVAQWELNHPKLEIGSGISLFDHERIKDDRLAAVLGNAEAQFNFAVSLQNGTGVAKDEKQAVEWFQKAAVQGDVEAQFELAQCFQNGRGVAADKQAAVEWYRKAADQGHAEAKSRLANLGEKLQHEGPS